MKRERYWAIIDFRKRFKESSGPKWTPSDEGNGLARVVRRERADKDLHLEMEGVLSFFSNF